MRHRAAKQMLQHEMCHWQERLACWIKDKDKEKPGTENSLAAQVNLGWFHSRKIPGVCVQQISLQLGWKLSPARASPTSPFHSLLPIPGVQTHGGVVWWPKHPLGPHQNPRQGCHPKGSARRMRDLLCSVACSSRKNSGTHQGSPEKEPVGHRCPVPGQHCPAGYTEEIFAPSHFHCTISAILVCSKPIYYARSRVGFCRAASVYPTKGIKLREASEL